MDIQVSQAQGRVPVTVLHIHGSVDAETHEQLENRVKEVMQDGSRYLLLDLSGVPYISSYGVRSISHIFKWLRDPQDGEDEQAFSAGLRDGSYKSRNLKLVNPVSSVMNVLSMTGVDMFLEIHQDMKKAVASF